MTAKSGLLSSKSRKNEFNTTEKYSSQHSLEVCIFQQHLSGLKRDSHTRGLRYSTTPRIPQSFQEPEYWTSCNDDLVLLHQNPQSCWDWEAKNGQQYFISSTDKNTRHWHFVQHLVLIDNHMEQSYFGPFILFHVYISRKKISYFSHISIIKAINRYFTHSI